MKSTKLNAVRLMAVAATAASFLFGAPVKAAETKTNVNAEKSLKPAQVSYQTNGYISTLESVMPTEQNLNGLNAAATLKTGFVTNAEGQTSYYDSLGQKVTGKLQDGDKEYYFDENGNMVTGFQEVDGKKYYYSKDDGTKMYGSVEDNGTTYQLQDDGSLLTGWVEEDGARYYYNEDGTKKTDTVDTVDGTKYTFDADGKAEEYVEPVVETPAVQTSQTNEATAQTTTTVANSAGYSAIANAALAQLGRTQDCTMLVTNSLAAVGINFHGWPNEYLSLGPVTSNPVPGDIIVYSGHVAIYIGNGQAVHGGWLGSQTVVSSVSCDRAFVAYVHPILP